MVVPATNDPPTLEACLRALEGAERPPDEIVVVRKPPGSGPAAARNAGVAATRSGVVVFVDADVVVHPDAIARIRARFEDDESLHALFGSYDDSPAAPGIVSRFRNLLHHHVHTSAPGTATTFWAGLGAVRRDAFLSVGGFDAERYPRPSIEDIELGERFSRRGYRIELDPEVRGTHLKRWTLRSMVYTDAVHRGTPWVAMLLRRGDGSNALNLGWRHRLSALASIALLGALATRRPGAAGVAVSALLSLNHDFYVLLMRREGPLSAAAGVGLHAVHHLAGVAAVPLGIAAYWRERRSR